MKTSKASSYAMHALMYMVRHSTLLPITNKVIAKAEGIPVGYLAKILQQLAKAGIVTSSRKSNGGYNFAQPAERISVLKVLNAIEGESFFDECFMKHCDCGGTVENCEIYKLWHESTMKIKEYLSHKSIVDATWKHPEHHFNPVQKKQQSIIVELENDTAKEKTEAI